MHDFLRSTSELLKRGAIRTTLNALGYAGIGTAAGQEGAGLVMTLHRVEPDQGKAFDPNALLSITPDFLETLINVAKAQGMTPIALCDAKNYIASGAQMPFIAFTLDDGYKNNAQWAAPVFAKHKVPYTIFISKGLTERTHTMWWETAAKLIAEQEAFTLHLGDQKTLTFECATLPAKHQAYRQFAQLLLEHDEDEAVAALNQAATKAGFSAQDLTAGLIMDREALTALSRDNLCHLAPHTVSHINLARATPERLKTEIEQSIAYIKALTGETPSARVFSYPYGKPFATNQNVFDAAYAAGMDYGVTTSPGSVSMTMAEADWMRLPRMSINGHYQSRAAAHALLCGVPTLLASRSRTKSA